MNQTASNLQSIRNKTYTFFFVFFYTVSFRRLTVAYLSLTGARRAHIDYTMFQSFARERSHSHCNSYFYTRETFHSFTRERSHTHPQHLLLHTQRRFTASHTSVYTATTTTSITNFSYSACCGECSET